MIDTRIPTTELPIYEPPVTMFANSECQVFKLEMPEVKRDEIELTIVDDCLIVHAADGGRHFYRRLPLCFHTPVERIETRLHDGIVEIRAPNCR